MSRFEKERDELADEYIGLRRAGGEAYLAGWDACAALYEEKLKVAVDILSFIEIESRDGSRFKFKELINEKAREALAKLKNFETTKEKG